MDKHAALGHAVGLQKAYNNYDFLNSPQARQIRVLCEFEEPEVRFRKHQIRNTVVFFGSARTLPREDAKVQLNEINQKIKKSTKPAARLLAAKEKAERDLIMSQYYEDTVALAAKLTRWSHKIHSERDRFYVCSGGGPGIMEAANRGARNANGSSIGLNISLPQEQFPNPYQSRELSFDFHYFFIRKFWFFYLAKAMVVFPGGFGTFDELFELLTLIQTGKTKKYIPIVVYGRSYWEEVVNFKALAKWGVIDQKDLKLFRFCDSVDEAFQYLKGELSRHYLKKDAKVLKGL